MAIARRTLLITVAVAVAACGGGRPVDDAAPTPDAPPDGAVARCAPRSGSTVVTTRVTNVDDMPVLVTAPASDPRLFIVQRNGVIQIFANGALVATPFLDLSFANGGPVRGSGERGLLGLAFHPAYATNRKFYLYYTRPDLNLVVEYLTTPEDPDRADPASARVILSIDDPEPNHNGGMIEFGPDGYLYIGTGDGGGVADPSENGQNPSSLLAKMLRIDVDHPGGDREYGIPPENPFVTGGGAPEVLMTGLRNPWRWSFDRMTADLYIGDVGQGRVEEINVIGFAELAGADFGWDDCEGATDFEGTGCATPTGNRRGPAFDQLRPSLGTSRFEAIIGGAVYRSTCYPDLQGRYFFSDHTAGGLWSFVWNGTAATDVIEHPGTFPDRPTSIYMDAYGELYIGSDNGDVSHIEVP